MSALKVYYCDPLGDRGIERYIVASKSMSRAAFVMGVSNHHLRVFGGVTEDSREIRIAMGFPEVLFVTKELHKPVHERTYHSLPKYGKEQK